LAGQVRQAEAGVVAARVAVSDHVIAAPVGGGIAEKKVDVGEVVSPGQGLFRLVSDDTVHFNALVPEEKVRFVSVGMPVAVNVDALPARAFAGRVLEVLPAADLRSRTFTVKVGIPNPGNQLREGMFARGQIVTQRNRRSLRVPADAVVTREQKSLVVRIEGANTAVPVPVELGSARGGSVEILSGALVAGDRVVTEGATEIEASQPVNIITEEGARHLEMIGRFDPAQPPARLLAEMWVAQGVMVGISLHGPTADWVQIQPLWPLLRQGFVLGDVARARDAAGPDYFHPSGQFALTLPAGWDIAEEMADGALLTEMGHLAQFQITFQEMDHRPTARDLEAAVFGALGDLPEQEGFIELAREEVSAYARLARFESVTAEEGIYRTELQAFANGNHLFSTSFSAPPHFWDTFAPAYELLMASLQLPAPAPPDEATQDADPIAGVMVGPTLFYRARGGSLWVSAPIHNYRTRNLEDLTAAVQLFDAADKLIVAESWRLQQRVLPAGATTYLTMRLTPEDYPLDEASYALVKVVDATDTQQPALAPWGYMGGAAEVNAQGDVAMRLTMRNASNETRNRIYLTALLYDAAGNLSFARAETMNLRRNVGPGERVELEMIIWGPFGGVFGFDAVGEVPQ
ncbi:MAG: efflux RND transporter periplasmic adaptor subunit, partial [Caldilineales bacterium]|nr:efflux RND transporter periplasmic adaptor subunit [Caldilineales bacterium]